MPTKPWILSVDLDGVLAKKVQPEDYGTASPIRDNVKKINELYSRGHRIVIHTARAWHLYDLTIAWLNRHQVKFSQLVMGKLYAHAYIDDKNYTVEEIHTRLTEGETNEM